MGRIRIPRSKKGVLLTLITVVMIILILSEITAYTYTSIAYNELEIQANPSASAASLYASMQSGFPSALRTTLSTAIKALAAYESTNGTARINDTQYALTSLMVNGQAYGANMVQNGIGGATLSSFISQLQQQAKPQNLNLSISNRSLVVFQGSPYSINVSYSAFAVINSSGGSIAYPLSFNASLDLQSTPDLYGAFTALQGSFQYSTDSNAIQTFSAPAVAGSRSPYMFAYGPLFLDPSQPASCSDNSIGAATPANGINPSQYILVAPDSLGLDNSICGFAALITYTSTVSPIAPYLVYSPFSHVLGYTASNGNFVFTLPRGRYAIDGQSLTLVDPTPVESAIQNQYYVPSGYSPSYLQLSSGYLNTMSPYGVAPLGMLERQVGTFNQNDIIVITNVPENTLQAGTETVSFWMQISSSSVPSVPFSFYSPSSTYTVAINSANDMGIGTGSTGTGGAPGFAATSMIGIPTQSKQYISNMQWVHVAAVFRNGQPTTTNVQLYLDGVRQNLQTIGAPSSSSVTSGILIGEEFSGQIADVQLYNTTLTPYQIDTLYSQGIDAPPVTFASLSGWWPLNGNTNDYSRYKNNGTVAVVSGTRVPSFQQLGGYAADTLAGGGSYFNPPIRISGLSQCYSIANCSYSAPDQLYVGLPGAYSSDSMALPQSYLGLGNSTLPGAAVFDNSQNSMITASNIAFGGSSTVRSGPACGNVPPSIAPLILTCIPINITNTQGIATPVNFQQLLPVPIALFSGLAGNVVVYNSISGALMPAWVESGSVIWVNLLGNTIAASSSANGIYYFGFGSPSTNFLISGNNIGEAPQLSPTYAQYDNGNSVFNFYDNFAGNTLNANIWQVNNGIGGTDSVSNYITLSVGSGGTGANDISIITKTAYAYPSIFEAMTLSAWSSGATPIIGESTSTNALSGAEGWNYPSYDADYSNGDMRIEYVTKSTRNLAGTYAYAQTAGEVDGIAWVSTGNEVAYVNENPVINSIDTTVSPVSNYHYYLGVDPHQLAYSWQWARARAYPPNGIMPTVTYNLGSVSGLYTLSFWTYFNPAAATPQTSLFIGSTSSGYFGVGTLPGGCFGPAAQSSGMDVIGIGALGLANKWINVVAEMQPGSALSASLLYINGIRQTTSAGAPCSASSVAVPGAGGAINTIYVGGQLLSGLNANEALAGSIADVQVYNALLTQSQIHSLYANNSVPGLPPAISMPLGSGYNGFVNQTGVQIGSTTGYAYIIRPSAASSSAICQEANAVADLCGVVFLPHEIPNS
jgi:hypothetical protein